ncbi:MAG TPA: hemerythrin domain-containing protein [Rhodanobacteraceae bacterium]|nr:hemerythrin domain-containing protein [Rhodanobacteraceae bacterium]
MKLFGVRAGKGETAAEAEAPPGLGGPEAPLRPAPIGDAAAAQATAPGTEIRYDPELIPHFVASHRGLSGLADQLEAKVVERKYFEATQLLRQFKTDIFRHFLEENVRFYTYLAYCLKTDAEGGAMMADMRREMGEVGRAITRFLKEFEAGIGADNAGAFLHQFKDVVAILADRIQREEGSLYTLYRPPSEFAANS